MVSSTVNMVVAAVLIVMVSAQSHNPFDGSNCTCETFCDRTCSIMPSGRQTKTFYRMTPYDVMDMANKNTGDIGGDTSFVLSRRLNFYECRKDPNSFYCNGAMTKFDGDDSNSTDLILEFNIEIDGNYGPYLYCNTVNASVPRGPWDCTVSLSHGGPPPPPQCKNLNFSVYGGYCARGFGPQTTNQETLGDCCAHAATVGTSQYHMFNYYEANKTCETFKYDYQPGPCKDGILGFMEPKEEVCNCSRVHETVGFRNLTHSSKYHHGYAAGGHWYSHPKQGECTGDMNLGDKNCTYKVLKLQRIINATCMYKRIDENVVNFNPSCFSACPQPNNMTSDCYLKCYSETTERMNPDDLTAPWPKAFAPEAQGGCPQVAVPPEKLEELRTRSLHVD